jgi:hypothetical protein
MPRAAIAPFMIATLSVPPHTRPHSEVLSARSHKRRRWSHKSKSVATSEELVINWVLKGSFIVGAIILAAFLAMFLSRR